MNEERFWEGKRVVVTGGAGMIGSKLSEFLVGAGATVVIMDNNSHGQNYVSGAFFADRKFSDATKFNQCAWVFQGLTFQGADAVFNLAATVGGVYYNLSHQADMFASNMQLQTVPVLAAAEVNVPIFLQTSSVCVYSKEHNSPAQEKNGHLGEPEGANAGYAWAKRMGERICSWAFDGTRTRHVIVRPTNVYGERDYYDDRAHVIPALIRKFTSGSKAVEVYGGKQSREFIYADDVARGMMVVAEHGIDGHAYNLGTSGHTRVCISYLAKMIKRLTGSKAKIEFITDMPTGDNHRYTDSAKAASLWWRYQVELEEGLTRVIQEYERGQK